MSTAREPLISNCEKKFLLKCLKEWTRLDGRAFDEFREIKIEFGKDWGCCCVSLGKTRVLAQVSCEIQQPKSSRPSEGILNINVELNPIAAPYFQPGKQSELTVQLNRILEKCIKDSKSIDLESLCIQMNEKVWALRVDINVLNHEGNILDCASIAALTALAHFKRPDVTCDGEEFIIHDYKNRDPIPTVIHHYPVCITYSIFNEGQFILADPNLIEEGVADAYLTIGLNAYRELCGLHLGGKALLTPNTILSTTNKAGSRASIVIDQIKNAIMEDTKIRQNKPVGFNFETSTTSSSEISSDLQSCLDQWSIKEKKRKNENRKKVDLENNENKNDEIESLGKGSAALIPNEYGDAMQESSSSESEEDVVIIEPPKEKPVEIFDSDSEEETVIILNADKKTKKRKR